VDLPWGPPTSSWLPRSEEGVAHAPERDAKEFLDLKAETMRWGERESLISAASLAGVRTMVHREPTR
jgi:hypothetical protein